MKTVKIVISIRTEEDLTVIDKVVKLVPVPLHIQESINPILTMAWLESILAKQELK